MSYYFKLQYQIIIRKIFEAGLHPALGILLFATGFILASLYLFYRTEFAAYIYVLLALFASMKLGEKHRNDFLKSIFSLKLYFQTRLLENVILALPFFIFLLYQGNLKLALGLLLSSAILVLFKFGGKFHFTIPTPFSRLPFEFTAGFRKSFLVYLLAFFLAFKSTEVQNLGLGIFSIILISLTAISHYLVPEHKYFVWIYNTSPRKFLVKKIGVALWSSTLISLPILLILCCSFQEDIAILLGIQSVGYIFLTTMVLAKYAAYPGELNLPQGILFALCFWFPPMLLIVLPIFYKQANKRLNLILK